MKHSTMIFIAKCALAVFLIFGLVFYVMHNGGSSVSVLGFIVTTLGFLAIAGVLLYFTLSISMFVNQWTINHGGTDTQ